MPARWNHWTLLALLGLTFALGCPTTGDDDDAANDDDAAGLCDGYEEPDEDFADLSDAEKRAFMECMVVPTMEPLFQDFDADAYADFGCATCHGEDREDVDHEMPNGLEELPISGFPFSNSSDPEEAAYGEFMEDTVVSEMAALLGRSRNVNDPNYFGCYDCHERP